MNEKKDKKSTRGGVRPGAGRPVTGVNYRVKTVTIDDATIERARKIGNGNISVGVRRAVAAFPISDIDEIN
jgi:hypothetical protein